ncbi:MAG: hypothetical protein HRU13_06285 [Phycisphaerales bacterium]|nr:hypothetical protein [Phycisphaerales bacterium]
MGGALEARVGDPATPISIGFEGDTIDVRSDSIVRPALELLRLRRAIAGTPTPGLPGRVLVRVKLGWLPAISVRA